MWGNKPPPREALTQYSVWHLPPTPPSWDLKSLLHICSKAALGSKVLLLQADHSHSSQLFLIWMVLGPLQHSGGSLHKHLQYILFHPQAQCSSQSWTH